MCDKCFLTEEDEKFLNERIKMATMSGARLFMINKETERLKKQIEKTNRELLLL